MHVFLLSNIFADLMSQMVDPTQWAIYIGLFATSFVKFFIAAIAAVADTTLSFWAYFATVGGGALVSVPVYTFFGEQIRRFFLRLFPSSPPDKEKAIKLLAKRKRRQRIWDRYGMAGVAFIAPFISPMISVGIAVSFNEKPWRIIMFMSISILLWTIVFFLLKEQMLLLAHDLKLIH